MAGTETEMFGFAKDEIYRVVEAIAGADPSGSTTIETEDLPSGQQPAILVVVLTGRGVDTAQLGAVEPTMQVPALIMAQALTEPAVGYTDNMTAEDERLERRAQAEQAEGIADHYRGDSCNSPYDRIDADGDGSDEEDGL
jgi:hypothetical protein